MNDHERELVGQAVRDTLTSLGLDVDDPHGMQADFVFLRQLRTTAQKNKGRLIWIVVGAVASGLIMASVNLFPWKGE